MSTDATETKASSGNVAPPAGTICWLEIPATDIPRVATFYNAVLGWTCSQPTVEQGTPSPVDASMTVHMFTHAGSLHGAFIRVTSVTSIVDLENKSSAGVLASFRVENLEQALNKVVESGGKVHVYVMCPDSLYLVSPLPRFNLEADVESEDRLPSNKNRDYMANHVLLDRRPQLGPPWVIVHVSSIPKEICKVSGA
jgi:predicted enzyme related to lactoylglutathione lyase